MHIKEQLVCPNSEIETIINAPPQQRKVGKRLGEALCVREGLKHKLGHVGESTPPEFQVRIGRRLRLVVIDEVSSSGSGTQNVNKCPRKHSSTNVCV